MQTTFQKLKEELKKKSISQVATALGYRSQSTIALWVKNKRIPVTGLSRVEAYFSKREKRKHVSA